MARSTLTVQRLADKNGQAITFSPPDAVNGHQFRNTGVEVVLVKLDSGSSIVLGVPSVPDPFGRSETISVAVAAANGTRVHALGPYSPAQIWGDGASQGFVDPSGVSGSSGVAVVII